MATKKQKQELMDTLKFTPCTYTLSIGGYGGETFCGVVSREIYEYFKAKNIDISQFASSWDEQLWADIPSDKMPFDPGSSYDCDGFFHASGATLDDSSYVTVTDDKNDVVWESGADYGTLTDAGVDVECSTSNDIADLDEGTVVFWGGNGEKGSFFEGLIELRAPFDPKKLTVFYDNCDDWCIITGVEYDGEEIDGNDGYSTTGKWTEHKWVIVGDEEVYEGEERDEDGEYSSEAAETEVEGLTAFQTLTNSLAERWNGIDTKPDTKGTYEVKFAVGSWPVGNIRNAEWTGRSWKENGKKAPEMIGWRELDHDDI